MEDPSPNRSGYQKTAVGWIPNEWECVRLGSVFTQSKKKGKKGLPVLSVTTDRGVIPRSQIDRKMAEDVSPDQSLLVEPGDLAYNMMRMWQGAVGVCGSSGVISPAYVVCRPLKTRVDPWYMVHLFKSHPGRHWLTSYSYGIHEDRLRLYYDGFALIQMPLPPLAEQHKIAAILSTWETAIEETRALIAAAKRRKKALMHQLLTGIRRLPEFGGGRGDAGHKTHDAAEGGVPEGWRHISLSELGDVVSGGTPDTERAELWGGSIPWVTPSEITCLSSPFISSTERSISPRGMDASGATLLPANSIIVCTRATVGACAINVVPMTTNQGLKGIVVTQGDADVVFLYYAILMRKHLLLRLASGSTFVEVSKSSLESIVVDLPPLPEQRAIASILTKADDEIRQLEAKAEALERQKNGLMQKLLTGEVRAKG